MAMHINHFDNDTMLLFLNHRTIPRKEFFGFMLVCKRWMAAVSHWCAGQDSIEPLFEQYPKLRKSSAAMARFTGLKHLVLGESPLVYPALLSTVWHATLTSLTLYGCMEALPAQMWVAMNQLTALRTLHLVAILPWSTMPDEMPVFGRLSEFGIDFYKGDIVPVFRYFGERMASLSIDNCIIVHRQLNELAAVNPTFGSHITRLTLGSYQLTEIMDDIPKPDNHLLSFLVGQVKGTLTDLRLRSLEDFNVETLYHLSKLTLLENLELEVDFSVLSSAILTQREIRCLKPFPAVKSITIHNTVENVYPFDDFTTIFPILFPALESMTLDYYSANFAQRVIETKQRFFLNLIKVTNQKQQLFPGPQYMEWVERFYLILNQLHDVEQEMDKISIDSRAVVEEDSDTSDSDSEEEEEDEAKN